MEYFQSEHHPYMIIPIRRRITIKFLVFNLAIFLTFAAYCSVMYLQSSINIEAGVGVASMIAIYATSAVFGLFITPILVIKCGPKLAFLMSQVCCIIYVMANFYPEAYALIPAGAIAGMGEATMWPTMMMFSTHYAKCYARYGSKDSNFYIVQFFGYLFSMFQISQVVGNLLSFAIFYAGKSIQASPNGTQTDSTFIPVSTDFGFCGANDCQDPNITQRNLNRYQPASQATLFIAMGVMGGMILVAIFIFVIFIPNVERSLEVQDSGNIELVKVARPENPKDDDKSMFNIVKKTFRQLLDVRQILISPFAIYTGLFVAYVFSELTRAFTSCMIGVDQVGLCMAIFAGTNAISSYTTGKLSSRFGRNPPLGIGLIADIGGYMIALFLIPTDTNIWVVYVMFVLAGIADGVWDPLLAEMHATFFPNNEDIAFVVWNFWGVVGFTVQFAWSTSVCVRDKIYFQIGLLCFSAVTYYVGELACTKKNVMSTDQKPAHKSTNL